MRLEEGLDTGPVLASRRVAIGAHEHVSSLTDRLAVLGAQLVVDALGDGVEALPPGAPQEGEPTYAPKVAPEELRLDWARPAADLERVVRLDRAWTTFRGDRLRVLEARAEPDTAEIADTAAPPGTLEATTVRTGSGVLELVEVQPAGKRPVPAAAWARGVRARPGEMLGNEAGERR
jgi:methionyl-tRNA formyltransferase